MRSPKELVIQIISLYGILYIFFIARFRSFFKIFCFLMIILSDVKTSFAGVEKQFHDDLIIFRKSGAAFPSKPPRAVRSGCRCSSCCQRLSLKEFKNSLQVGNGRKEPKEEVENNEKNKGGVEKKTRRERKAKR